MSLSLLKSAVTIALAATLGAVGEARLAGRPHVAEAVAAQAPSAPACECPPAAPVMARCPQHAPREIGHTIAGIEGRVVDKAGHGASGQVRAESERQVITAEIDAGGRFSLDLPPGEYALSAQARSAGEEDSAESEKLDELVLAAGERIVGIELRVAEITKAGQSSSKDRAEFEVERASEKDRAEAELLAAETARADARRQCTSSCAVDWQSALGAECTALIERLVKQSNQCRESCAGPESDPLVE